MRKNILSVLLVSLLVLAFSGSLFAVDCNVTGDCRLETVLFATGSAEIRKSEVPKLEANLAILKGMKDSKIVVEGHTDIVDTEPSNADLSKARAQSVKNWYVKNGIAPSRITMEWKGETDRAVMSDTGMVSYLNRRVETFLKR